MMNLRHIGSVSAAARDLNVSQPSVSKVLRHAESRIGVQLFRTVRGRLVPTDEAHVLFREAREIYERMESLQTITQNLRRGGNGHVGLAVLPSLGLDVVPSAVAAFQRQHGEVTFEIGTCHKVDIARLLLERQTDIVLAYDAPTHPRLAMREIGEGELVALFRKGEFAEPAPRMDIASFDGLRFVAATDAGIPGGFVRSQLPAIAARQVTAAAQTYYVAAALVRRGGGFTIIDEFTARACGAEDLEFRPLVDQAVFKIYAIHIADKPLTKIESGFLDIMARTLRAIRSA
jgi:DNA-binding transcriptional LysR family regulator